MAAAVLNSFYSIYLSKQSSTAGNTITVTNKPLPETPDEQVCHISMIIILYYSHNLYLNTTCIIFNYPFSLYRIINVIVIVLLLLLLLFYCCCCLQIDDSIDGFFGYLISYIAVFGTCFLFSSFVITLIQEKESKVVNL